MIFSVRWFCFVFDTSVCPDFSPPFRSATSEQTLSEFGSCTIGHAYKWAQVTAVLLGGSLGEHPTQEESFICQQDMGRRLFPSEN